MTTVDDLFAAYSRSFEANCQAEMTLPEYLEACRKNPMMYATAAERLLAAIGEPEMIDTSRDARLGRIFMNRTLRIYPALSEFNGMEETIERIVGFLRHATQGLEERKQIMYLLGGPVGVGKSLLTRRLQALIDAQPLYVLKAGDQLSPVFESPLGLFDRERMGLMLEDHYGIPQHQLTGLMSPWCIKRLDEFEGDISRFRVVRLHPSRLRQISIASTEPGDENNQDISSLVSKVDIRKLELHAENDPDAYNYLGGLNRADQGLLEFIEMFKAPVKMLHPLQIATLGGDLSGIESIHAVSDRFDEAEWQSLGNNGNKQAWTPRRIHPVKLPPDLRVMQSKTEIQNSNRAPAQAWKQPFARHPAYLIRQSSAAPLAFRP